MPEMSKGRERESEEDQPQAVVNCVCLLLSRSPFLGIKNRTSPRQGTQESRKMSLPGLRPRDSSMRPLGPDAPRGFLLLLTRLFALGVRRETTGASGRFACLFPDSLSDFLLGGSYLLPTHLTPRRKCTRKRIIKTQSEAREARSRRIKKKTGKDPPWTVNCLFRLSFSYLLAHRFALHLS
jgi:hypothetical protein